MKISLHFKDDKITPHKHGKGGSNSHVIPCQQMQFSTANGRVAAKNTPVICISFSPQDMLEEDVKRVISNRKIDGYGDNPQQYIEIPCDELYSASVRTDKR
jgi:hypothetical protein